MWLLSSVDSTIRNALFKYCTDVWVTILLSSVDSTIFNNSLKKYYNTVTLKTNTYRMYKVDNALAIFSRQTAQSVSVQNLGSHFCYLQ